MSLNPDLTDDVAVHTDRKDGTLYVLLVDEIDDSTIETHAANIAAMGGDGEATEELKRELVERALREALKADVPEAYDPSTPTVVNVDSDRNVKL
jgi:hypothetical protein